MTDHLGYPKDSPDRKNTGNSRNDKPRDRDSSFDPQLIRKRQVRLVGFDEKVIYTTNAIESLNASCGR